MLKLFPASYSNEDRLSYIVALVELIPGVLALAALARLRPAPARIKEGMAV